MAKNIEQIRKSLHLLKPRGFRAFIEMPDSLLIKNLQEILDEYHTIQKIAKDLLPLKDKGFQEALSTQASEYLFFRQCSSKLKGMLDFFDALVKYARGREYKRILNSNSKDISDRAINSLIDSSDDILDITQQMLKVKELYDTYQGIVDAYNQRGYSLNNITKGLEMAFQDVVL